MKRIIITGATGLIGTRLVSLLKGRYDLTILTRSPEKYRNKDYIRYLYWDGKSDITQLLENAGGVINLLGENIGRRTWSNKQKHLITESRKDAATAIQKSIEKCVIKPNVWIQASATGYYGQKSHTVFDETSPKGDNSFLADVCEAWERPINELNAREVRKVIIRTGVVLSAQSDFCKQLSLSFGFGIASILGDGKQYTPWIHLDDEVKAIRFLLENDACSGIFNLVAPQSATMEEIVDAMKQIRKNMMTVHIPVWILNMAFGKEKTSEIIMTNQHVIPERLLEKGFVFKYPDIVKAVKDLER